MFKKLFSNQRGLTLIELLASLSLLSMVTVLATTILIQTMNLEKNAEGEVSLRQQANLLVTTIRNTYLNETDSFTITYQEEDGLYINEQLFALSPTVKFAALTITYNNESVNLTNSEIVIQDNNHTSRVPPLEIDFTLTNEQNRTYSLTTTVDKHDKTFAIIPPWDDEIDVKDDYDNNIIVSPIDTYNELNYTEYNDTCVYNENITVTEDQTNEIDCSPAEINGSVQFESGITTNSNLDLSITGDMFNYNSTTMLSNSTISVVNNARLEGDLTLNSNTSFEANYVYVTGNITVDANSELDTTQGLRADGHIEVGTNSMIDIGENLFANSMTMNNNATVTIGVDADFTGPVFIQSNNNLTIGGSAIFNDDFTVDGGVVTINGDATFYGGYTVVNGGKVTINGNRVDN